MPVSSTHPQYDNRKERWHRVRDVLDGEDSVKAAGTEYLPKLPGQNFEEYEAYKNRSPFPDFTRRTVDGLVGAIFRRDPVVESANDRKDLTNVTGDGTDLVTLAKDVVEELVSMARFGLLVDMSSSGEGTPFIRSYKTESMINWRTMLIDGVPTLNLVVLHEVVEVPREEDEFEIDEVDHYRVLQLIPDPENGQLVYTVKLFQRAESKSKKDTFEQIGPTIIPSKTGKVLNFIPFQFLGSRSLSTEPEKPPISGLVDMNIAIYLTSVDLKHGAHYTALPTPWVSGDIDDDFHLDLGPSVGLKLPEGGQAGLIEYTGQGLDALMNISGLYSFMQDQKALDNRVRSML